MYLGHETFADTEYQDDEGQRRPFKFPGRSYRTVVKENRKAEVEEGRNVCVRKVLSVVVKG
jgi:hypothetical protein